MDHAGAVDSDTGSGKSLASIRLAERVDPAFSVDRIVFTVKEFIALVNAGLLPRFRDSVRRCRYRHKYTSLAGNVHAHVRNAYVWVKVNADPEYPFA
jgi:hypothetical protein